MKKIFESKPNYLDESAEKVYVYALESEEEYWEYTNMTFEEKCDLFDVRDSGYVAAGATYYRYAFDNNGAHVVMYETIGLNV